MILSNFRFVVLVSWPTDYRYVRNSKIPKITWGEENNFYDDIAMIKLRVPIEFTNTVRPICLPSPGETFKVILISCFDSLNIKVVNNQDLYNEGGIVAGYGVNSYWIKDYENLIGRTLKIFEVADKSVIDLFEVSSKYFCLVAAAHNFKTKIPF